MCMLLIVIELYIGQMGVSQCMFARTWFVNKSNFYVLFPLFINCGSTYITIKNEKKEMCLFVIHFKQNLHNSVAPLGIIIGAWFCFVKELHFGNW